MAGRVEYDQLVKYNRNRHARVVYHRVWRGSVSYRNKGWDLLQLGNFGQVFYVRISWVVTELLSRHCIIG